MAAFAPALTGSQSNDGFLATFNDASPYGANDEGYQPTDFSRSIVLTDSANNVLATLPLAGSVLVATFALAKDQWVNSQLVLLGHGGYSVTKKFAFSRITKNVYRGLAKQGCCCRHSVDKRLSYADIYFTGAEIEALSGNGPAYDTDIFSAYAYLTGPEC